MTVDTTVVNGRFITPPDWHPDALSIRDGVILQEAELEDVWRTVDAAGHCVLPGVIHVGDTGGSPEILARHGVTTVIAGQECNAPVDARFDHATVIDLDSADDTRVNARSRETGRRICQTSDPNTKLFASLPHGILRVTGSIDVPVSSELGINIIQVLTAPDDRILDGATLEVSFDLLRHGAAESIWELLLDVKRSVILTAGSDPTFPLLHFLFEEGVRQRGMTVDRVAQVTSGSAAASYRLHPHKGRLAPGAHGDLVVFDPDTSDPYRDEPYPGRVIFSLRRGDIFFYNGQIHATGGSGIEI